MLASHYRTRLWRVSVVGLAAAGVGVALAMAGLGLWGFVIAAALSATAVGFVVDLGEAEETSGAPVVKPEEVAPPVVEPQEVAPLTDEQMRTAKARAKAAEWLTLYLHSHGPTTLNDLLHAAAQKGIGEAGLTKAVIDMGIELHLPDTVKELVDSGEPGSIASEIDKAKKLLDAGAITQSVFEALKETARSYDKTGRGVSARSGHGDKVRISGTFAGFVEDEKSRRWGVFTVPGGARTWFAVPVQDIAEDWWKRFPHDQEVKFLVNAETFVAWGHGKAPTLWSELMRTTAEVREAAEFAGSARD